jgi:hypothetical protein
MTDQEKLCGKCWKLDRTKGMCERYDVALVIVTPGRFPVYEKCEECLKATVTAKPVVGEI